MLTRDPLLPARSDLETALEFETLISDLSSRFIDLPPGDVDREIEEALRRVCESLGVDLAVLWQWSVSSPGIVSPTHAYPALGGAPSAEPIRQEQYPWMVGEMRAGHVVRLSSLDEVPAEGAADRENARRSGIRSSLCLPLSLGGGPPVGALALSTLRSVRNWPDRLVHRLQLVSQVFTNALARSRGELSLRASQERLAAAVDLAGLAFYEVDFGERTVFVDDLLVEVCGIPPTARPGLGALAFWGERLHPEDRARVLELREDLHSGRIEQLITDYRYLHPGKGELWLHHVARVTARDANARVVRTFGVLRDITEQRQREEALRRSYAEIERLKDRLQAETDYLRAEVQVAQARGEITGRSAVIQQVRRQVGQVAPTDSMVLVLGETGTGKELVAQAIHRAGPRRGRVMVRINCAALPAGLVESELFGREKGAYTGALSRQAGRFEIADGSTLFLDEVGELSPEIQAKLLRVLETGEFERLGSPRTLRVNVRVIAATHRDLAEEVRKGRFREDLYYRLAVFPVRVPPLRERPEDIPLLVWEFLEEFSARMGKKITQVPRRTMETLQRYVWPGNVRELRNVIEHGAIITTGDTLRIPDLVQSGVAEAPPRTLAEAERDLILRALERAGGHVKGPQGAAVALGLKPATLYSRMKKLGILRAREGAN